MDAAAAGSRTFARLELDGVRHPVEVSEVDGVSVATCRGQRATDPDPVEAVRAVVRAVMATVDHDAGATMHMGPGPRVTAPDDGLVRSHDEMLELLRYAVPGARVALHPVAIPGTLKGAQQTRRYTIAVPCIGRDPVPSASMYSLPCPAAPMIANARRLADDALVASRLP